MSSGKRLTVHDIAEMAGVSIGTVDRVLHRRGRVSPATEMKIQGIIENTGFVPNPHASKLAQGRSYFVAVLTPRPEQDSGFWALPHQGIRQAVGQLDSCYIDLEFFCFNRESSESFKAACARVVKARPDGILLAPVLAKESEDFVFRLNKSIPVCCFDTDLPNSGIVAFVGQNSYASGQLAARLMKMLADPGKQVAIIQAVTRDYHIEGRIKGFQSLYLNESQSFVFEEESLDKKMMRKIVLDRLFLEDRSIGGIFVTNDSAHLVADYLQETQRPRLPIIGYDLIPQNRKYLEQGVIDFILNQRPITQGAMAFELLFQAMRGHYVDRKRIMMPIDILTAENAPYYPAAESSGFVADPQSVIR